MKNVYLFVSVALLSGCMADENQCVLPTEVVGVKLTSIVSKGEIQLRRIDDEKYGIRFSTYHPVDGKRLYTALGTGTCRNQQLTAEFTGHKVDRPELMVVNGSFIGTFSKDPFGKHYGEWTVKVELLADLQPMPFEIQEAYGKRYVNDKGIWSLQ